MPFPPYVSDYNTPGPSPTKIVFTSRSEMERLLSFKGVHLHLDDANTDDENYLDGTNEYVTPTNVMVEIIDRVTARIMEYLAPRYDANNLYEIPTIREIATYMACHELSRRRGNEPLYDAEVAGYEERLERYREGTLFLNAPSSRRAYVQSFTVDNRYYRHPIRVIRPASTHTVAGQQVFWDYFPFFWL
jgi:hypothetical protein